MKRQNQQGKPQPRQAPPDSAEPRYPRQCPRCRTWFLSADSWNTHQHGYRVEKTKRSKYRGTSRGPVVTVPDTRNKLVKCLYCSVSLQPSEVEVHLSKRHLGSKPLSQAQMRALPRAKLDSPSDGPVKASSKNSPSRPKSAIGSVQIKKQKQGRKRSNDPFERGLVVSGGLPSLGKRR